MTNWQESIETLIEFAEREHYSDETIGKETRARLADLKAAQSFGVAQAPALDRYRVAKLVYATWLDADFITENHFAWFDAGKDNPESCVHYSNVAKAFKVADRILGLTPSVPSTNSGGAA